MNSKALGIAALVLYVLGVGCASSKGTKAVQPQIDIYRPLTPSTSALLGDWLAMTDSYLYIYRLSLAPDGSGILAYSFATDPPQVLPVIGWQLEGRTIRLVVDSSHATLKPITIQGTANVGAMHVSIQGSGWEQDLTFTREEAFERRCDQLKRVTTLR
jgi:hypothetical protein